MFMEVYYEHYREKSGERYWEDKKFLPYLILERSPERRERIGAMLKQAGFCCVGWNDSYPALLVTAELKRFAVIVKPCRFSCMGDRNYSTREFLEEVYFPWKEQHSLPVTAQERALLSASRAPAEQQ